MNLVRKIHVWKTAENNAISKRNTEGNCCLLCYIRIHQMILHTILFKLKGQDTAVKLCAYSIPNAKWLRVVFRMFVQGFTILF